MRKLANTSIQVKPDKDGRQMTEAGGQKVARMLSMNRSESNLPRAEYSVCKGSGAPHRMLGNRFPVRSLTQPQAAADALGIAVQTRQAAPTKYETPPIHR